MSALSAAAAMSDPAASTGLVLLPVSTGHPPVPGESVADRAAAGGQDTSSDARILQLRLVRPPSGSVPARRGATPAPVRPRAFRPRAQPGGGPGLVAAGGAVRAAVAHGAGQAAVAHQAGQAAVACGAGQPGAGLVEATGGAGQAAVSRDGQLGATRCAGPTGVTRGAGRAAAERAASRVTAMPDAAGQAASWRLTRRGRAVLVVATGLAVVGGVLALWLGTAARAQASGHGQPAGAGYHGLVRVVVQPGQTLWSIAAAAEPSARTAAVIQQIIDANALRSGTLYAGELLWVPGA
jgi:hypothetical protein